MSTLELLVEELKALPAPKLEQVVDYVHQLREINRADRLSAIKRSAEVLTDAEGAELERVIMEGCEKIDARDW